MKEKKQAIDIPRLILVAVWSIFLGTIFWLLLFMLTGDNFSIVRLISYIIPLLVLILISFSFISLFLKKYKIAFSIFTLAFFIGTPFIHLFFPSQLKKEYNSPIYKVMTYSKMGRNHNIKAVADIIISEKPDIIFIQEISSIDANNLIGKLKLQYQENLSFFLGKGLTVSRFNIVPIKNINGSIVPNIIELEESNIKTWNVHLKKSFFNTKVQYKQVNQLAEQVSKEKLPMIVAGDFNATSLNYPYIKINQYLDNAFSQAGLGFGFTFPSSARGIGMAFPFMRIDHIFYCREYFNVHNSYVLSKSGGSDHYPLITLISFKS